MGTKIKMNIMKTLQMYIGTNKTKNYSEMTMFILGGHFRLKPYIYSPLKGKMYKNNSLELSKSLIVNMQLLTIQPS